MKKQMADWLVKENISLNNSYFLLKLTLHKQLPEILPGQFVQVKIEHSPTTFLRRPISVHFVDRKAGELWLLIQQVGDGTRQLATIEAGEKLNLIYPLGNSFTLPADKNTSLLLIGGGVGVAPLLYLGAYLKERGYNKPAFLLGARTENDLLQLEEFSKYGEVHITTENGQAGEKGFVTNHSVLQNKKFDFIYSCGPKPMMMAVAKFAKEHTVSCEVSLENTMACGIGACLCCVEKTKKGNTCVCMEGPVFNINELTWPI
ncbi:dihydroorotate dehydrogenase B (NAD(+)), electron transfer subunit [Bacteroidia bacterium]|nr:dihydroorotate dehydrogenase B (NAD(+)), electron transfer subunit [Bacteroidia bacterium]